MNTQSNVYTIIYSAVMVVIVAVLLTFTAQSLREKQKTNEEAHKKNQILNSIKVPANQDNAGDLYKQYITETFVINAQGEKIQADAFSVDIAKESRRKVQERALPVYVATLDGQEKYILPVYGAGLWGPLWGYVAFNADKNTIYGVYFSHKGETPGLGAEIEKEPFQAQFVGKRVLGSDSSFTSVAVLKKGMVATEGADQVDAISGGTITSQGVDAMLKNSLSAYQRFLKQQ